MFGSDYVLFLLSQALSELGDHLWSLGLRNYLFENSPWTPAAGIAAVFVLQAIPVFLFGPWLTSRIGRQWRKMALAADLLRMAVTLTFALILLFTRTALSDGQLIFMLLAAQLILEAGSLVFQNCRNCLVPVLYPNPNDIPKAHLWANVASLSAAGVVPLIFVLAMPSQEKIKIEWLAWAAIIDAVSFAISGAALMALKRSRRLEEFEKAAQSEEKSSFIEHFTNGFKTVKKYPGAARLLLFSFFYNICLMGPFEIGHITFLRSDLALPPAALAINLVIFLAGIFAGTFAANILWKGKHANHLNRFSKAIFWDGLTFFPICLFALLKDSIPHDSFLIGLAALFFFHYAMVPFVKVSRLAGIQTLADKKDWSTLLGFHAVAVEGASAVSVIVVALAIPNVSGTWLLALGGAGATLCGAFGMKFLRDMKVN